MAPIPQKEALSAAQRAKIRRLSTPAEVSPDEEGGELNVVPFLGKQPTVRVAPGKYTVKNWTITVTEDAMEFYTPNVISRMSIRRASGDFMHNNRAINGK